MDTFNAIVGLIAAFFTIVAAWIAFRALRAAQATLKLQKDSVDLQNRSLELQRDTMKLQNDSLKMQAEEAKRNEPNLEVTASAAFWEGTIYAVFRVINHSRRRAHVDGWYIRIGDTLHWSATTRSDPAMHHLPAVLEEYDQLGFAVWLGDLDWRNASELGVLGKLSKSWPVTNFDGFQRQVAEHEEHVGKISDARPTDAPPLEMWAPGTPGTSEQGLRMRLGN